MRFSRLSLAAAGFVLAAATFAHADTIAQGFFSPDLSIGGNTVLSTSINQFNPALGTLESVMIRLSADAFGTGGRGVTLQAADPMDTLVAYASSFTGGGSFWVELTGTSGNSPLFGPDFIGTGQIEMNLSTLDTGGSGTVEHIIGDVTYTYDPAAPSPAVPEPSSIALFGTGVLGLAGALRRRIFA